MPVTTAAQQKQQELLKQVSEQQFDSKEPPVGFEAIADPPTISALDSHMENRTGIQHKVPTSVFSQSKKYYNQVQDIDEASSDEEAPVTKVQPPVTPNMAPTNGKVVVMKYDPKQTKKPVTPPQADEFLISPIIGEQLAKRPRAAPRRTDIFGVGEEETKKDHRVTWDGHTSSAEAATRAAMANITLADQVHQIHNVKGLLPDLCMPLQSPVMIQIKILNMTDKSEWKLNGLQLRFA